MDKKIKIILMLFCLSVGCKKLEVNERAFPIITTLEVTNIDQTGVTFQGKLIQKGKTPTMSYGFVWDTQNPMLYKSHFKGIVNDLTSDTFSIHIDSNLIEGLTYSVRAFATYNSDSIVYGNSITFTSKGCSKSSWSLEKSRIQFQNENYNNVITANSFNGLVYISFGEDYKIYSYNPISKEIKPTLNIQDINNISNTKNIFSLVSTSNNIYASLNNFQYDFFKFDNNNWDLVHTNCPFPIDNSIILPYLNNFYAFRKPESIIEYNSNTTIMYNSITSKWVTKNSVPTYCNFINGSIVNNNAFLLTDNYEIWKYDFILDSWIIFTKFPGNAINKYYSFTYNNKLYLASYFDANSERKIWCLDITSKKWTIIDTYPQEIMGNSFCFTINNLLYIGCTDDNTKKYYNIWKFDPSKIK
jgi:hypothetical protein